MKGYCALWAAEPDDNSWAEIWEIWEIRKEFLFLKDNWNNNNKENLNKKASEGKIHVNSKFQFIILMLSYPQFEKHKFLIIYLEWIRDFLISNLYT